MKSLIVLWSTLAVELASGCCTCATPDIKTVRRRTEHEGLSFLTITLANFGKDFQKSLDQGFVDHAQFAGFRRKGGLPLFLGGFLDHVFSRCDGVLLDNPSVDAISSILQLSLMYGKIQLDCSKERVKSAMDGYIESEKVVRETDARLSADDMSAFKRMSRLLFMDLFTDVDRMIYYGEHIPKHGPGLTAEGFIGNEKFLSRDWADRLECYFPAGEFLYPNWRAYVDSQPPNYLEPGSEVPVKVTSVPKTLKTPRIIGQEPACMMFCQQAILELLVRGVDRSYLSHFIGFSDQTRNQRLARKGSTYGSSATLDLSDASDRVSNQLVRCMLSDHPHLQGAVDACRSRRADVPGHGVVRLAKFASMGSALCFPFEAFVFLTCVFLGIEKSSEHHLTPSSIRSYGNRVSVYGDDIIVSTHHVHSVIETLEHFGAKVGLAKSFWTGKFRESCGGDYYDGRSVRPTFVRRVFPGGRTDVQEIISLVSLRNQFYRAGCWDTVEWIDSIVVGVIRHFPIVGSKSPLLGRHDLSGHRSDRFSSTHQPLVKGWTVRAVIPPNGVDGYDALLKYFLKRGDLPIADRNHLTRSGRPRAVNIKLGYGLVCKD